MRRPRYALIPTCAVSDWVLRFNDEGPDGLIDRKAPGPTPKLDATQLEALIGLVLPWCDTNAMNAHLAEISAAVAPGAHAVLIMDQAGWHTTAKLKLPANITVLPLPSRSPELNPVENLWQFMRDNWLSNRIFESYDQIVSLCCYAWSRLRDQPWRVMSIGRRAWAHA